MQPAKPTMRRERRKMSKSIKVSEEVYQELLALQRPRETFSQVVERLIHSYELLQKAAATIGEQKVVIENKRPGRNGGSGA